MRATWSHWSFMLKKRLNIVNTYYIMLYHAMVCITLHYIILYHMIPAPRCFLHLEPLVVHVEEALDPLHDAEDRLEASARLGHVYVYVYMYMYMYVYACIYIYIYIHMYIRVYIYIYIYMFLSLSLFTHIYVYIYIYVHIVVDTYNCLVWGKTINGVSQT